MSWQNPSIRPPAEAARAVAAMNVRFHDTPAGFAAAARDVASRSPASEAFVAAWCSGLERHPPSGDVLVLFATATAGDERALAMQHGANPVLLENSDPGAAAEIARALVARRWEVPGVSGREPACDAFAEVWCASTGARRVVHARLRHHLLERVESPPLAAGAMRPATHADAGWLVDALEAFKDEARVPAAPQGTARLVAERLADDRFRIWDDGGPVSFCGANPVGDAARIGPVWTPRAHRRRGYATALVAQASRERLARGATRLFLVTDIANPTSNGIYARIGYRPLGDAVELRFVPA